ncbi:hypothetical protein PUN28_016368 [Cardiocondyla obscurior]|uniref:Uncharacterized protein n=1 Tax=Cardiocondyla obscurior TaxID=286306 RepID=A0AAW2ENF5_9HYME
MKIQRKSFRRRRISLTSPLKRLVLRGGGEPRKGIRHWRSNPLITLPNSATCKSLSTSLDFYLSEIRILLR